VTAATCFKCGRDLRDSIPAQPVSPASVRQKARVNGLAVGCIVIIAIAILGAVIAFLMQPSTTGTTKPSLSAAQRKAALARQKAAAEAEQSIVRGEKADLKAAAGLVNQAGNLVTGYAVQGTTATIQVDADAWDNLSDQDKQLMQKGLEGSWSVTWEHYHSQHPETQLNFYIVNLANDQLFSDIIDLRDTSHPERAAYEQQRLSGAGAYKVVEQWSWCADGLGQRAIVLSHNSNDLVPAFHRFLASLNGDRSKCITFEVFTDQATLDESKSSSEDYPDSELVHQWTHELQYTNNPNSGLEEWNFGVKTLSDGTHDFIQHVIHAGN
jgi:hypothetical protein